MSDSTNRVRRVYASAHLVLDFIRRMQADYDTTLPADALPVRVYVDPERDAFVFIVESEQFEPVETSAVIPELVVTVTRKQQ